MNEIDFADLGLNVIPVLMTRGPRGSGIALVCEKASGSTYVRISASVAKELVLDRFVQVLIGKKGELVVRSCAEGDPHARQMNKNRRVSCPEARGLYVINRGDRFDFQVEVFGGHAIAYPPKTLQLKGRAS